MKTKTKAIVWILIAATAILTLSGCGAKVKPVDDRTVLTVGEYDVCYDIFRYIFLSVRDDLCGGNLEYYIDNALAQVSVVDETIEVLKRYYGIKALAKENGVELSNGDEMFEEYFDYYKSSLGSDENVKNDLEENYLTEYSLREMYLLLSLRTELYDKMTEKDGKLWIDDAEITKEVQDNFLCFRYIFVDQSGTETEEYALSRINEAYQKAVEGEDFKELIESYSESSSLGEAGDYSCYLAPGSFQSEEVEEIAKALEVGQISEVIETDDGWFIIQKTEKDSKYIEENLSQLRKKHFDVVFSELLDSSAASLSVKYTDLFSTVNVLTMK